MEEKKVMTHVQKGLLVSLILIIIDLAVILQNWLNKAGIPGRRMSYYFIAVIWACIHYANQMNNQVTFGNIFGYGFKMSIVVALIMIIYVLLVMISVVFPDRKEKALEMARQRMEERGNLSDAQIDQGIEFTKKFFLPFVIGAILLGTVIFGAIASLIGAAVAKKKPVNPLDQMPV